MMRRNRNQGRVRKFIPHRTGAALYMMVVFNAFLLGMLGLTALAVSRIERRQNQSGVDVVQAKRLATSGIRLAKLSLDQDENWRTTYSHDLISPAITLGSGSIELVIKDLSDTDLADDASDSISITAVGTYGEAVWAEEVQAEPMQGPPEFLTASLHAAEDIYIDASARVRMSSAPISTNQDLRLEGILQANGECLTQSGGGTQAGVTSTNQAPKAMPEETVFADYQSKAMALTYSGSMSGAVLNSNVNTYGGGVNPDGIYYINPGNNTLLIEGVRIEGTLLIDGNAEINSAAYIRSADQSYPSLIVNGNLLLNLDSKTINLRESDYSHNFNPIGAEYLGSSDSDEVDQYPNQIEGLVHVRGNFYSSSTPYLEGCLVCEGTAVLRGTFEIQHDISLYSNPPIGYEELPGPNVKLIRETWKRVAVP